MSAPPSLHALVEALERLPGIGTRSAQRLAHHLLRVPEAEALALAEAIGEARRRIRPCSRCRTPAEQDPCRLCADAGRDASLLMVVSSPRDLESIEAAGGHEGLYWVLGGPLSPLEGRGVDALDLDALRARVAEGGVAEVCVATNPDLEGDATALAIARALDALDIVVTRLARGLPAGGQIEYQSAAVLAEAFTGRRRLAPEDGD